MTNRTTWILAAIFALGSAGSAHAAASGPSLSAGGNTLAGPGATSVSAGGTTEIFAHSGGGPPDVCVTVVNKGRVPVSFEITGATNPTALVPVAGSRGLCAEDVTAVEVVCAEEQTCSVQWRVDDN